MRQRQQFVRLRIRVIDAIDHDVLEGDEIARRPLEIALAGSEQCAQRILAVDRHEFVTQPVVRSVQRDRQRHRALVAQPVDGRHEAGSRHGDPPPRQAVGVVVEHQAQRAHGVVEVGQRFAHAHQDDVADQPFTVRRALRPATQRMLCLPELANDLRHRQVAVETLLAGRAKGAVERAAGLR